MNELQLVLLIFAVILIGGLWLFNRKKTNSFKQENSAAPQGLSKSSKMDASQALNELGEGHIPVSPTTEKRIHITEELEEKVPESQGKLSFGEEFDLQNQNIEASEASPLIEKQKIQPAQNEEEAQRKPKHYVIYDESMKSVAEADGPTGATADITPSFGKPAGEEKTQASEQTERLAETSEPQIFVIIVMGSQEFGMSRLNQALLGVGLNYADGAYVKKDSMGNEFLHVANIFEPGIFPSSEAAEFDGFSTQGVALILQLPTSVKAPAAMNDMIMIARKVSQKLNGRLYDGNRHLLKESDIQAMRDAAIAYETIAM